MKKMNAEIIKLRINSITEKEFEQKKIKALQYEHSKKMSYKQHLY